MPQWPAKLYVNATPDHNEKVKSQVNSFQTLLCDVSKDANETQNLAAQEPELVAKMIAAIATWKASVEARLSGADYVNLNTTIAR